MKKFFLRFLFLLLIFTVSSLIFLSYFGIQTEKFNDLIKDKANQVNQYAKLNFENTKIYLRPSALNLVVKLKKPKILIANNEIKLSKLDLFLSLKSFFDSNFIIEKAEIAFAKNDIKDLTKITNVLLPKFINKRINKIFTKGNLTGEFVIPFNPDGSVEENYAFFGRVTDATINLTRDFTIKTLTTEITYDKNFEKNGLDIEVKKGSIYNLDLSGSSINLKNFDNKRKVKALINTNGNINFLEIKKLASLFNMNTDNIKNFEGLINLKTNVNFNINNRLTIKNLTYSSKGKIQSLEIFTKESKIIKKYLPEYNPKINFKNVDFKFTNSHSDHSLNLNGLIKLKNNFDNFEIKENYNRKKKYFDINGTINLTSSVVKFSRLNYSKDSGKKSDLSFDINFILNKYLNVKKLNFNADQTKVSLSNAKFNNNFEIKDFDKFEVKTIKNGIINNDFLATKSKKIIIKGKVFDAQSLLKSLYKKTDKKTFSKKFNSEIKINFDKTLTGTDDVVSDFSMIASIKNGSYNKLSLKGDFSKNEVIEMSIYQVDKDTKTLQIISDRARPFVKNFDFIQGFEEGKLEYESTISKNGSNSNLIITGFKVSKVPALARLLTLASLQGIADTLGGEGIRFEFFEMKSNSNGNVLNIEDALAIGPAISILLNGYIDKGKVVSLRGTLVPATKLNSIIASIPVVGDILVGKKTGEGVVGVSFKMKGPPKDIKTTVNPIKTLTPRFIVRAVEKMKKKRKEESK